MNGVCSGMRMTLGYERDGKGVNYAIIMSGGIGTRMKMGDRPKQYIEVGGRPILAYTLERFQKAKYVDRIVIVAAKQWRDYLTQWIDKLGISRFYAFADPGETRQESVLSGLKACLNGENTEDDLVAVQDGVRPLLSVGQIEHCIEAARGHDGVLPVRPMVETIYHSEDGSTIDDVPDRSKVYSGQTPEVFRLLKYVKVHDQATRQEIAEARGSSVLAFKYGMDIALVQGDERAFKLTTKADMEYFCWLVGEEMPGRGKEANV